MPVLAIDLGGTKLATAIVDREGTILSFRNTPVRKCSFAALLDQIAAEADAVVTESDLATGAISRAGLIVPGIAASNGLAWAPNLWGDADVPLLHELSDRLPMPLVMESDRAGYIFGEHWLGIAKGLSDVVFVAIGTGIGAGILCDGRLIRGAGGAAGAVGWMALDPRLVEAYAAIGCWEAESAGPGVARNGGRESAKEVVAAARNGDSVCCRAIERAASFLGMGVANLVSTFNPQMVVLGGGLMQAGDLFIEPVRRAVRQWANPRAAREVRIELSQLGERTGLLGAARLALDAS